MHLFLSLMILTFLTHTHTPSVTSLPCVGRPCCGRPTSLWPSGSTAPSLFSNWLQTPPFAPELAASGWGFAGAGREPRTPSPPTGSTDNKPHISLLITFLWLILISFWSLCFTSKSRYCATSTYPGRPSVSRKSRRCVMAIFPTPRLVFTEEDTLKTHSLGSMCSRTDAGKHTWESHRGKSADFTEYGFSSSLIKTIV